MADFIKAGVIITNWNKHTKDIVLRKVTSFCDGNYKHSGGTFFLLSAED